MSGEALDAIVELMNRYFEGLYHADAELLSSVLHPKGVYASATGSTLVHEDIAGYLDIVRKRRSPASRGEQRADSLEEVQLVGTNTAFVRAHCRIADRYFTDFLTLIRVEDEWRILSKVFHYEPWPAKEAA